MRVGWKPDRRRTRTSTSGITRSRPRGILLFLGAPIKQSNHQTIKPSKNQTSKRANEQTSKRANEQTSKRDQAVRTHLTGREHLERIAFGAVHVEARVRRVLHGEGRVGLAARRRLLPPARRLLLAQRRRCHEGSEREPEHNDRTRHTRSHRR